MVNKIRLSFEDIFPFVRHVHLSGIEPFNQSTLLKALDYRLFYIYDGKGSITIKGQRYNVNKGNLFLWQPGTEYMIYSDPSHYMVIIGINFDFTWNKRCLSEPIPPENTNSLDEDRIVEYVDFIDMDSFNGPIFIKDFTLYESILLEVNHEYVSKKRFHIQRISGLFLSLTGIIARYVSASNASVKPGFNSIDLILDYIHTHYDQPISNRDIGSTHNFHPNYINKLMVLHTGVSLHQYIINYRISKAVNLMQTTGKSISEIAYSVGFKDMSYFSKAFKYKMGESPGRFKVHSLGRI